MTEPRIVESGEVKLVGVHGPASFGDSSIRDLWRAFRPKISGIANRASEDFISMRIYVPPLQTTPRADSQFVYWAAVEVEHFDGVPSPLATHTIANGLYAVFEHRGTADSFGRTAELIFGRWLPDSPYQLAAREFFEILGPSYRPDDPAATEHVWIPLQHRR